MLDRLRRIHPAREREPWVQPGGESPAPPNLTLRPDEFDGAARARLDTAVPRFRAAPLELGSVEMFRAASLVTMGATSRNSAVRFGIAPRFVGRAPRGALRVHLPVNARERHGCN
jgi:hypothetical protein